jgi:RNA polymerase sigma-70 factor (ECF subfamily)
MTPEEPQKPWLSELGEARERFLELVAEVRPELHRYCARMTGSIFDGEDIVQDTLAKAYYALAEMAELPPLRPWLFRIAHNRAMDFLRRYEHKHVELVAEPPEDAPRQQSELDPLLVEAALAVFVRLPPAQRSALVLKDVLGQSLEETADAMGTTVAAVKAALVRARANVGAPAPRASAGAVTPDEAANLKRYAQLFNARDWEGVRALLAEQARLDLVSRWQRRGEAARQYFTRYAAVADGERLRAEAGQANGAPVIAVFQPAQRESPAYFLRLSWQDGRVVLIRDFRYVPYITADAHFERFD